MSGAFPFWPACKIVLFVAVLCLEAECKGYDDICHSFNGKRIYAEFTKMNVLTAKAITAVENDLENNERRNVYKQCRLELTTCTTCVFNITFMFLNISENCNSKSSNCECDYIWIYEPPYHDLSGRQICGNISKMSSLNYRSKTRTVAIIFFFKNDYEHAFTLQYVSERNRNIVTGLPGLSVSDANFIATPYFPKPYLRDFSFEYVLKCDNSKNCRIGVTFTDFLIGKMSVIEFFDWDGKRLEVATGMTFRPRTIISNGPSLSIRFYANGASNRGFKASYVFLFAEGATNSTEPKMRCGGLVDNLGGGIIMTDVVKEPTELFDCVWIVNPSRNFLHFYKHLYLKVVAFSEFAGDSELLVHKGLTSTGPKMEVLKFPADLNETNEKREGHLTLISQGFYVRFKGIVSPESKLAIAYTAFGLNECISGTDFSCSNKRCIPVYLQCDGFDHCGDGSDEYPSCFQDLKRNRWPHSTNFFFPQADQYNDLQTVAIIFLVSCFGMVSLILGLVILIFRINGRAKQQRQIDDHLGNIRELLGNDGASIEEEIVEEDEPPRYEAPPNYQEAANLKNCKPSKPLRRVSCSRCSHRLKNSKGQVSTSKENSNIVRIFNLSPPHYSRLNFMIPRIGGNRNATEGSSTGRTENRQLLGSHDFLRRKLIASSKKRKVTCRIERAKKFFPYLHEIDSSHCKSDSEIPDFASSCLEVNEITSKLCRSFSFEGL